LAKAAKQIFVATGILASGLGLTWLAGCGQFFPSTSTSSSGSGSSTAGTGANAIYVANSNPSLQTIAGFTLSTATGTGGQLTALANSPYSIGETPSVLAINPTGTLLYDSTLIGNTYVFVINSDGSLTLGNSNTAVLPSAYVGSLTVDPSGNWLIVGSSSLQGNVPTVQVYQIDKTNGSLTAVGQAIALDTGTLSQITFAPNGTQAFAALGTGGVDLLTFDASTGSLGKLSAHLNPLNSSYADIALAVDPLSKFLFVTETGTNGVRVLGLNTDGTLTEVTGSPYATGLGAHAVLVDATGSYVYVSNSGTDTISGFSISSTGTLTALAGSPFATGTAPYSLAEDSSGGYLIAACSGGSPDLQVFAITPSTGNTPGALTSTATASTGTVSPAVASDVVTSPPPAS
jgi:6-phosphogluconolactonase (cycloisomerase 2 family)